MRPYPSADLEALSLLRRRTLLGWASLLLLARRARAQDLPTDTFSVLDAAACRIVPSDGSPGAREARVGRFIERQLTGSLSPLRPAFDQLARLLDLWSRQTYRSPFTDASADAQDAILAALAHGRIPARGLSQEAMFRALHTLTLEGFLSDPAHGGNDGEVGWKSIGFPEPHLRRPGGHHGR